MKKNIEKRRKLSKRAVRIRKKIKGLPDRPRLSVARSAKHLTVQAVDDVEHTSLLQLSSKASAIQDKIKDGEKRKNKTQTAKIIGKECAEKLKEIGVKKVVFDRKGYPYSGRVKALADEVRKNGIEF